MRKISAIAVVTTTIRLRLDGSSTDVRVLMKGDYVRSDVTR